MPYEIPATSSTPAFIIYVLDVSASMQQPLSNKRRIDIVTDAFAAALRQMIFRSTKGTRVSPRYRLAMFAYSDDVYDLLGGTKTVDQVAQMGVPELNTVRGTDTFRAFLEVEKLLMRELPNLQQCPAPLVCHMTDGEYTGNDPEPVARRIMNMRVPDGNVLLENIFISDRVLSQPISSPRQWPGILPDTKLADDYAKTLRSVSSPLPKSYWEMMREDGYQVEQKAVMMLPGTSPELVQMGFAMSAATPVARRQDV